MGLTNRVIRIIELSGPADHIADTLENSLVKGQASPGPSLMKEYFISPETFDALMAAGKVKTRDEEGTQWV